MKNVGRRFAIVGAVSAISVAGSVAAKTGLTIYADGIHDDSKAIIAAILKTNEVRYPDGELLTDTLRGGTYLADRVLWRQVGFDNHVKFISLDSIELPEGSHFKFPAVRESKLISRAQTAFSYLWNISAERHNQMYDFRDEVPWKSPTNDEVRALVDSDVSREKLDAMAEAASNARTPMSWENFAHYNPHLAKKMLRTS